MNAHATIDHHPDIAAALAKSRALLDAITFDEHGKMIAGKWMGGNGGLISRSTLLAADDLRKSLELVERR